MPSSAVWPTTAVFQSMLSKRRATSMRIDWCTESGFQSTLSKRRATLSRGLAQALLGDFNPRSPSGERLYQTIHHDEVGHWISIHTLQAESDLTVDSEM